MFDVGAYYINVFTYFYRTIIIIIIIYFFFKSLRMYDVLNPKLYLPRAGGQRLMLGPAHHISSSDLTRQVSKLPKA